MLAMGCGVFGNAAAAVCHEDLDQQSVARRWNEQLLDAIRRDTPAPTVHARNLYHLSAAMWDAWAMYESTGTQLFADSRTDNDPVAQEVTISYAAHTLLTSRYRNAVGGAESTASFDAELERQCLDIPNEENGDDLGDPAQRGIELANAIIDQTLDDGSFELNGYLDIQYPGSNPTLFVPEPGVGLLQDPDRWQPLRLEESISQNDQVQVNALQFFIGPHWGSVTPFSLEESNGLPIDPGGPPKFTDDPEAYRNAAVDVLRYQLELDTSSDQRRDYGPASIGNNPVGTNEGEGFDINPVTGEPYEANELSTFDFGRVVAEFWADGPSSETPPGHWNTVANEVNDHPDLERKLAGAGETVDRLEWDIKVYLALNGAMHDAAIAAWGAKRVYDSARPITLVRYLAGLGQSTDPDLPRYDPNGLPLIDGMIELVTESSSADRHAGLAADTIAVRGWAGHADLHDNRDRIDWIDGETWVPYQLDTFVTPSFPGYVSGHSAFSRAGAEVLSAITGSMYFPGGLGEWTAEPGWLRFDEGPSEPVTLQWATYFDAADQAGESRIWGGIHIAADDFDGREVGQIVGRSATERAFELFGS